MSDCINAKLDLLFKEWEPLCPDPFVRDGVVCEETFLRQARRVVFVLAEPNYIEAVKSAGNDLRRFYRSVVSGSFFYQGLARWTRLLLDGQTVSFRGNAKGACAQLRRIATVNLKKVGGGGFAYRDEVAKLALAHRDHLVAQLKLIQPDLIVACGGHARDTIPKVVFNDAESNRLDRPMRWNGAWLLPSAHPSWAASEQNADATLRAAWRRQKVI